MNITNIVLGEVYAGHQKMLTDLARGASYSLRARLSRMDQVLIRKIHRHVLPVIDAKVKSGQNLQFEDTFVGMALVLGATNCIVAKEFFPEASVVELISKGTAFLQLMAVKESLVGLTAEEIAGMVAATTLDIIYYPPVSEVTETAGMGGDRGFDGKKKVKTINVSTLSAIVLSAAGYLTMKHGSLGNTTKVGSSDVPVRFGANINQSTPKEILRLLEAVGFWYSDAHGTKTVHYLSHLLMCETVNHIIGPMTPPVGPDTILYKVIGVNHHVPPWVVAEAYTILHRKGFIKLGGVVVVSGLDQEPPYGFDFSTEKGQKWVSTHSFLDELAPVCSLVSIAQGSDLVGTFILHDKAFGDKPLVMAELPVVNEITTLMKANQAALNGTDLVRSRYLARNAALGLLVRTSINTDRPFQNLSELFQKLLEVIVQGKAMGKLVEYVEETGGSFVSWE